MKKIIAVVLVGIVASAVVFADTVTNRLGQVMTVTKLSDTMAASTAVADQSVLVNRAGEVGMVVANVAITASTAAGSYDISLTDLPKGAILMKNAIIEVTTALGPATSTNALAIGGVTVVSADNSTLHSTGIKDVTVTPAMTTAADKLALTLTGSAATSGVFTVYLPYTLGTAR